MEDKKENKTFIMILIGIIGLCLVAIGITYAYWILTRQQTGENVVNTACLNINFTGENDITIDKAYPLKLEELESFLSKATPYHFTIENTCDDLATATINLESINAGAEKQLQDEYIDAILYETDYHTNLNSIKKLSASMYNDENKVISNSLHAYELYNFVLQKGETKSFNLLLYMDPDTPMETANMNASWKGKITLSTSYKEEPTANLNGLKVPVVETGDGLYAVPHEDLEELGQEWNKTEYRYAGENPNNYVLFNNEIWRIIGLVNVKVGDSVEQKVKIVRTDGVKEQKAFGNYAWDKPLGYTNNWTTSKLKDMLNGIYYKSSTGECYTGNSGSQASENTCDFNSGTALPKGLDEKARNMVDREVIWNIGGGTGYKITAKQFYEKERGTTVYNDDRATEWSIETDLGENHNGIGLMYPSDFGYAVGGKGRNNCLTKNLFSYEEDNCNTNDWLKPNNDIWTLLSDSTYFNSAYRIYSSGFVSDGTSINKAYEVWPTLYLKSSVKITTNSHPEQEYGTVDNPFVLSSSN